MFNTSLRCAYRAATLAGVLLTAPLAAATITVTPATFDSAVAAAKGGDTLALVGTFGHIAIVNRNFASTVTINASRATFTNTFTIANVDNLTIGGGTFNIAGAPAYTKAVAVYNGRSITVNGAKVSGSAGGEGVVFSGTIGATVANTTFTGLQVAAVFGSVNKGTASRNTITGAVSDGIDIANSHGVMASNNTCAGGTPGPGVHPDCIQLWSVTGNPLQSQIIVRNNSATGPTQGFTAFSTMGGEMQIQIINNVLKTSYPQGVACYECIDSNISDNLLTTLPGAPYLTNLNVIGGSNNTVVGNIIIPRTPGSRLGAPLAFALAAGGLDSPDTYTPDLALLVGNAPAGMSSPAAVPEPSSWALLLAGFAAVGIARRRASRPATA